MEEPQPGSGSATDDFEHVELDHSPKRDSQQAAEPPAAAAGGAEQAQAAPTQPPTEPAGEGSGAAAVGTAPAVPAAPAAAAEAAPSSPPATKALQSVLGFFTSIAASPPPAATERKEAPAAGGAAPQQAAAAASSEGAADAAAAAGSADAEPYDPVAAFENEALEAAERLQHGVEEVRGCRCWAHSPSQRVKRQAVAAVAHCPANRPQPTACLLHPQLLRCLAALLHNHRWARSCCMAQLKPRSRCPALPRASAAGGWLVQGPVNGAQHLRLLPVALLQCAALQ